MKRDALFSYVVEALKQNHYDQGVYFVKIIELAHSGSKPHTIMTGMVSLGGLDQKELAEPVCYSFDYDEDSDVKRLTAIVSRTPHVHG